jgi:hypothetical protein
MRLLREFWSWIFLGLTSLVLGLEIFAAVGPEWATTWTEYIVTYIPVEAAVAVWGASASWTFIHFWFAYRRKKNQVRYAEEDHEWNCPWCDLLPSERTDCRCTSSCGDPWCPQSEISP